MCAYRLNVHAILDIFNITVVTIFGLQHRFDDGFTYGQAFWMTVCSTITSTITNVTLMIDYYRTPDFDHSGMDLPRFFFFSECSLNRFVSGSGLTHKQRSLVIIVIILLCYIAMGALIMVYLLKLSFIDALYLTVVSIETIGMLREITKFHASSLTLIRIWRRTPQHPRFLCDRLHLRHIRNYQPRTRRSPITRGYHGGSLCESSSTHACHPRARSRATNKPALEKGSKMEIES